MKKMVHSIIAISLATVMVAGCGASQSSGGSTQSTSASSSKTSAAESTADITIAAALPSTGNARFVTDDGVFKDYCTENGYKYVSQFAESDVAKQVQQIETFISQGVDAIICCPVDGQGVSAAVKKAMDAGIAVVSFDRMVMDTEIDYYATFDNLGVGRADGQYIVDKFDLDNTDETYTLEIFTGDVGDNNALLTYEGAMEVLQPYIDEGKLVVKSGQTKYEQVTTVDWDSGNAQERMETILATYYKDEPLDAVCTTYANLAIGAITACKSAGYGTADKPLPITTGQDAEIAACKSILAGELTMSILKDDRVLCPIAVDMCIAAINGEDYPVNDTTTYDNGTGPLKTYLGEITVFDASNIQEVVIDSGVLSEEDLA